MNPRNGVHLVLAILAFMVVSIFLAKAIEVLVKIVLAVVVVGIIVLFSNKKQQDHEDPD